MILLKANKKGYENGHGCGKGNGNGNGYGKGNGYGYGFGIGIGYGNGYDDGNGRTNPTVTTDTLHSATVLAVATQLITYYGGRWV